MPLDQERVRVGTHACEFVVGSEHQSEALAAFTADGLRRDERVVLMGVGTKSNVTTRLCEDGNDPAGAIRRGQLLLANSNGRGSIFTFGSAQAQRELIAEVGRAIGDGYSAVRVAGVYDRMGAAPHESVLHTLVRTLPVTIFCPYVQSRLSHDDPPRIRELHDHEVVMPVFYNDGELRITQLAPGVLRIAGEVDATNRASFRDALITSGTGADGWVDVDLASLRFIDVAGVEALLEVASELGAGSGRVRIRRPYPMTERVARLLAAEDPECELEIVDVRGDHDFRQQNGEAKHDE